jgi:hypothetical protein
MSNVKTQINTFPIFAIDCGDLSVESMYTAVRIAMGAKIGMSYIVRFVDAALKKMMPVKNQHFAKRTPFSDKGFATSDLADFEKIWNKTGMRRILQGRNPLGNSVR